MIVVDSSAVADWALGREPEASWVEAQLDAARWSLHAPHVVDLEVVRTIRRFVLRGELSAEGGRARIDVFVDLRIRRYPHTQLLELIWALRDNVAVYDAAYVALAAALEVPLLTTDLTLARTPRLGVQLIAP